MSRKRKRKRKRNKKRGRSGLFTRRKIALLLGGSLTAGSVISTDAFSQISADRSTQADAVADSSGLIGLTGDILDVSGTPPTEPQPITISNNTETSFTSNGKITITSENEKLRFRLSDSSGAGSKKLDKNDFPTPFEPGDSVTIDVLTGPRETGTVDDGIEFIFDSTSGIRFTAVRDILISFRSAAQLVYADSGDIQVYDTAQNTVLDPPNPGGVETIGSIVADITGDGDADIVFSKSDKISITQSSRNSSKRLYNGSPGNNIAPNESSTRISAGVVSSFPGVSLDGPVALFTDKGANKIYAVNDNNGGGNNNNGAELIADTSNVGAASGVSGVEDIDGDGKDEIVYLNSSQQINYITKIDTTEYDKVGDWDDSHVPASSKTYSDINGKVLGDFKDSNNSSKWDTPSGTDIALGKVGLGNAGVGANNNVGISAIGNLTNQNPKLIPFVDGSGNLAVINHYNQKTNLSNKTVAKKAAIAPVDEDNDDITEIFFIGKNGKVGGKLPDLNVDDNEDPIYFLKNPDDVIESGDSPDYKPLIVPKGQRNSPAVDNDEGYVVPDESLGLNAGTTIEL